MHIVIQNLLKLQTLEFGDVKDGKTEAEIARLRATVPAQVMGHYDRLRARDKKGVAVVRNQNCSGCHMHIPIGQITVLMRDEDVQLCESCGRYLYLPDASESAPVVSAEPVKPARKPRKRKVAAPEV